MNMQLREPIMTRLQAGFNQASLWRPDAHVQSAWAEHVPFGFWLVSALRPCSIVELGVHHGFSYFVFCQAVKRLGLNTRCTAVDTWRGDPHAGFYGSDVYEKVRRHNQQYAAFSRLMRSTFDEAREQFVNGSIDLLHIDGSHSYEAVRNDFESWLPKMSRRGVVIFHDIAERQHGFGVFALWEELRRRYAHFEFMHGHGLGVLVVGENVPMELRELCLTSLDEASAQTIRSGYERLGVIAASQDALSPHHYREIVRLRQQVQQLEGMVESYRTSTSWRITTPLRLLARVARTILGSAPDVREPEIPYADLIPLKTKAT